MMILCSLDPSARTKDKRGCEPSPRQDPPRPLTPQTPQILHLQSFCWAKSPTLRHQTKSVSVAGLVVKRGPPALKHKADAAAPGYAACTLSIAVSVLDGALGGPVGRGRSEMVGLC
jgi:hypothetical protein